MNATPRRRWRAIVQLAVSAALLALLFRQVDAQQVAAHVGKLSLGFVLLAWAYYAACQWLSSYRWQMFVAAKGITVPLKSLFSYYMIGMFLNNFLPGAVGGDAAKVYYLYRRTGRGAQAFGSVFLERFAGLLGLSIVSLIALGLSIGRMRDPLILGLVGATALVLLAMAAALWWAPLSARIQALLGRALPASIGPPLQALFDALSSYRRHPGTLARAVALSVAIQTLYALYFGLVAWGLGIDIDVYYFLLFLPPVTLVMLVPISFGGLGVREVMLVVLFAQVGVGAADVLAVSLTAHVLNTLLSAWGGLLMIGRTREVTAHAR
jgi:glycosyltransferase 2 family protein